MIDPYKILGLNRDATVEQIESAFRSKSRQHHPDQGGDPKAYEQFKRAYLFLIKQKNKPATDSPVSAESGTQPASKVSIPPIQPKPNNKSPSATADQPSIDFPDLGIDTRQRVPSDSAESLILPNQSGNSVDSGETEPFINLPATRSKAKPTKRNKSKSIAQPVMMIFSGLFGLISAFCVSVVGLWYFGKHDPFGLFTDLKSQDQTVAKSQENSLAEKDDRKSRPEQSRKKAGSEQFEDPEIASDNSTPRMNQGGNGQPGSIRKTKNATETSLENDDLDKSSKPKGADGLSKVVSDDGPPNSEQVEKKSVRNDDSGARNDASELAERNKIDSSSEAQPISKTDFEILLDQNGGTVESEIAVEQACEWIVRHQRMDGSWSFNHQLGPEKDRNSPDPGLYAEGYNGATAMALLPLLSTGSTHLKGKYQKEIKRGIDFLAKRGVRNGNSVSYWEEQGTMYSHGLCAIVFNMAYHRTKDARLSRFAKGTVLFCEYAQDPKGGGWRYKVREPGDTSVLGWQVSALKLGELNKTKINPNTIKMADEFLTKVSSSDGAFYGYMDRPRGQPADARTAIGLFSRLKLGWDIDATGIVRGIDSIAKRGPRIQKELDCYYNYYATCLMKERGGKDWSEWNGKMRDYLVSSQNSKGPAKGSWDPGSTYSDSKGGRIFVTALSCLTLQAYYHDLNMQRIEKLDQNANVNPKSVAEPKGGTQSRGEESETRD